MFNIDASPQAVALSDVDGDGDSDAIILSRSGTDPITSHRVTSLSVLRNTCVGDFFDDPYDYQVMPGRGVAMGVGDLNTDGRPDVVTIGRRKPNGTGGATAFDPPNVTVSLNDGTGKFPDSHRDTWDLNDVTGGTAEPADVAIGDLDNDGDLDIVVVGAQGEDHDAPGRVWILWNQAAQGSAGFFLDAFTIDRDFTGTSCSVSSIDPKRFVVADLDHQDGRDIVLSLAGGSCNLLAFRNHGGTNGADHGIRFDLSTNNAGPAPDIVELPSTPISLGVGRFDGDDDDDIAALDGNSGLVYVLRNRWDVSSHGDVLGGATPTAFTDVSSHGVGVGPVPMVVTDLDGDGLSDILVGNQGNANVTPSLTVLHNASTTSNFNGFTRIRHRDASTNAAVHFPDEFHDFVVHRKPAALAAGDVTRDDCPDIAGVGSIDNYGGGNLSLFIGRCNGDLSAQQIIGPGGQLPTDIKCGQIGGPTYPDGKPLKDLVVSIFKPASVQLWRQDIGTSGGMSAERVFYLAQILPASGDWGAEAISLAVCDYNTDGYDDVAVMTNAFNNHTAVVRVLLLDATTQGQPLVETHDYAVDVKQSHGAIDCCDMDSDGDPDIVAASAFAGSTASHLTFLTNHGDGSFDQSPAVDIPGDEPVDVILVDCDTNGTPDVVVVNSTVNSVTVVWNPRKYLDANNNIAYDCSTNTTYDVGSFPVWVDAGHLDDDGFPDLVVADKLGNNIAVLMSGTDASSNRTFQSAAFYHVGMSIESAPNAVAVADVNGDCLGDIVTVHSGNLEATTTVLRNDANTHGAFHEDRPIVLPSGQPNALPAAVTACDLNDDCKPDIASAAYSYELIRITWNQCDAGDTNNDDKVDGCDIQVFVNTYINPSAATWHDFNRTDITQDHYLDLTDVSMFVAKLLCLPCESACPTMLCHCGNGGGGGQSTSIEAGGASESRLMAAGSQPAFRMTPELQAKLDAFYAWWIEHPRGVFPGLTDGEYGDLVFDKSIEMGLHAPSEDTP